ncbi:lipoprotein [Shewanella sp. NIFS-20-20]|nr:lipoprotein [Shewanella sp. NIFS-20-20]MBV7317266.1 lipoprotein [Shewanella sp. NIFS-20-20]
MRLFLIALLASLFISGCGQKGPLYKTPAPDDNRQQEHVSPQQ